MSQLFLSTTNITREIIDILIIAFLSYKGYMLIRNTRAIEVLKGLFVLLVFTIVVQTFKIEVATWLLKGIWTIGLILGVIIFQPELRQVLARIGKGKFRTGLPGVKYIDEIIKAVQFLSRKKLGAIIALTRNTGLANYIEPGVKIGGEISCELLENIFMPVTPLHDGGVIIEENRIAAAACFFPLSERENLPHSMGTRHRAALGLSEVSDALIIVVSGETGRISLVKDKKITQNISPDILEKNLMELHNEEEERRRKGFLLGWKPQLSWKIFSQYLGMKLGCLVFATLLWGYVKYILLK